MIHAEVAACRRRIADAPLQKAWMVGDGWTVTYGDLAARIDAVAGLAADRKLSAADRVVIATHADNEAALLWVALVLNGLTAVNLDPDMGAQRACTLIQRAAPRLLILDRELARQWEPPFDGAELIEIVPPPEAAGGLFERLRRSAPSDGLHAALAAVEPCRPHLATDREQIAYILFTSGTTSGSKGVCISYRALFAHLATLSRVFGYDADSAILNTLLLSHVDGMIQSPMIAAFNGATTHRPARFEVRTIALLLDAVYRLRITHFVAVPTMLALMARLGGDAARESFQGSDFRLVISCAAALEPGLWEAVEGRFGVEVVNVYGLTETVTGGVFAASSVGSHRIGTIGRPVDCELRVVDDEGCDVADDESGELLMRGDLLMSGYLDDPEQTAAAFTDGWFRTGDIARRSREGLFVVCGRKKQIIIRGGLNVHPEEITEAIGRHPSVLEAVTLGAPDPDWGERVVLLAVTDGEVEEAELLAFCGRELEPMKVPSRIVIVPELPRGPSGKVLLQDLGPLLEPSAPPPPVLQTPVSAVAGILEVAQRCFRADASRLQMSFGPDEIAGWDSLAHMEFVEAIESRFDVMLTPREIAGLDRLDKLLPILQAKG